MGAVLAVATLSAGYCSNLVTAPLVPLHFFAAVPPGHSCRNDVVLALAAVVFTYPLATPNYLLIIDAKRCRLVNFRRQQRTLVLVRSVRSSLLSLSSLLPAHA